MSPARKRTGFTEEERLAMKEYPFALTALTEADEARIFALVKKAVT